MVAHTSVEQGEGGVSRVQPYSRSEVFNGRTIGLGVELEGPPVEVASQGGGHYPQGLIAVQDALGETTCLPKVGSPG